MEKNKLIIGIIIVLVLVIGGVAAFNLMQPGKPTIERANVILDESIKNTLNLTSFTTKGNADFKIKSGETVIVEVAMRDMQISTTNVWDFANQNSETIVTYDIMMNLPVIADLIEPIMPLLEGEDMDMLMGIDPLEALRGVGEANIVVTMEVKSIDFDSYMKITEITGLREIATSIGGTFLAEMVMGEVDPLINVWHKTLASPEAMEEMKLMTEKISPLMDIIAKASPDILYVKEVLPNTKVDDVAVYNFVVGRNLEKTKDFVIALIPVIGEMIEADAEEIAGIKRGVVENWPKVVAAIEAIEIDTDTYISRRTKFVIKETGTINVSLYRIMVALRPMITEGMTSGELAEFDAQKEAIRDINFVVTGNFIYSNHNKVPAIAPPAEYQIVGARNDLF